MSDGLLITDAEYTRTFRASGRLRRALVLAVVVALAGWTALWFRAGSSAGLRSSSGASGTV